MKYFTALAVLLLPFIATQLSVNGYHLTGLALNGLALILFVAAAGVFGLRVLLSLFKQDNPTALKSILLMLAALGMVLLTTLLMMSSNQVTKPVTPRDRHVE